jgi:choline dehydrogenase-like flavoprotein
MPIITANTLRDSYDVVIVGSGAGGGQAAYILTLEGAKVLMLEAGRNYDPVTETPMFQTYDKAPLRGARTPDLQGGFYDATRGGGWKIKGEPFTCASNKNGENYEWWRARMLGGRTNHWGRISLRNGPYDLKSYTRDGLGFYWPISYEDVAPYYDKVEMLIGVYGANAGLENTPDSPPGCLLPPPKPLVSDLLVQKAGKSLGIPVVAGRRAVLTKKLDADSIPARLHPGNTFAQKIVRNAMKERSACIWATECGRGCSIRANYQSTTVHLPPAMATGNLDILPNAMAREITLGKDGKANGITFIDKTTGAEEHASARVVVVAASAMESVRLLLNSKSTQFPQGLGNSSGLVGKYIMDTVGCGLHGQIPILENLPPHNEDGVSGLHMYVPWWLYQQQIAGKLGFARGYHIEFGGGRRMPSLGTTSWVEWLTQGSYGRKYKEEARRYYGSFVSFAGRGEMIPNENCYCEIDPSVKDQWGIPVLRFHWRWSQHEIRQAAHMQETFAEIIHTMGGRTLRSDLRDGEFCPEIESAGGHSQTAGVGNAPSREIDGAKYIQNGGSVIHEVGGAIMGSDPKKSVTNSWSQMHDVPNVVLSDGAPFASNADKNPTLTIMALSWRANEHLVSELKKGNL